MVIKMDALGQFGWNVFGSFVGSSLIIFFLIGIVKFSEAGIRRNITRESDIVKRLVEKFGSPTNDRLLNLLSPSDTEFKERWLNHRKRCGIAELWFVGGNKGEWWTNQLVIHNMESGRVLQDLKWRCWWRRGIPRTTGGENTFVEDDISTGQALIFLDRHNQVVLCFRVERDDDNNFTVLFTDKLGRNPRAESDIRMLFLEYKFRRALVGGLFKCDIVCRYGILDRLTIDSLWQFQELFRSRMEDGIIEDGVIPITYADDIIVETSTTV